MNFNIGFNVCSHYKTDRYKDFKSVTLPTWGQGIRNRRREADLLRTKCKVSHDKLINFFSLIGGVRPSKLSCFHAFNL